MNSIGLNTESQGRFFYSDLPLVFWFSIHRLWQFVFARKADICLPISLSSRYLAPYLRDTREKIDAAYPRKLRVLLHFYFLFPKLARWCLASWNARRHQDHALSPPCVFAMIRSLCVHFHSFNISKRHNYRFCPFPLLHRSIPWSFSPSTLKSTQHVAS